MKRSAIEWTDSTWNPITGCDKVSNGCQHCYAERMAARLQAMGSPRYRDGFKLSVHSDIFDQPLAWKTPRVIFVNSMSDLFHEGLDPDDIKAVFSTMNRAHWHTFQVLTKRPFELSKLARELEWTPNIWMGVTVESDRYTHRIDALRRVPAEVRFVSFEPLLSRIPMTTDLSGIHWAIVGGESGPGAREMETSWARDLRALCRQYKTAFFFKQWGGVHKKKAGRTLDGQTWDEMPAAVQKRLETV